MALLSPPPAGITSNWHSERTPYISTVQTYPYTQPLQTALGKAEEQPLRYLSARNEVEQILLQVDHAQAQGADWDDEAGQPVVLATAKRAKDLLIDLATQAESAGKAWARPAVSATPDGGIHLSWLVAGNRVALTVFAPYRDTVCVGKLSEEPSRRELLSDYGAIQRVMKALETSPLSSPRRGSL